jgi:hypothetical protein
MTALRLPVFVASLASLLTLLSDSARAQGADDCALPTAISGTGAFAFSNTTATTGAQGQTDAACFDTTGQTAIENDLWFGWIAPTTDTYVITTCGGTTIDSKMAVYAGNGCPSSPALDCNDDTCGTQSSLQFGATSGALYTIQLGNWPSAAPGSGQFFLSVYTPPPPCGPNSGPDVIVGDLQEVSNYVANGGVDAISLGTYSCNIGTSNLNWIAGNSQHPVIGGNLYRWRLAGGSGRFEQIGMSWLKHGFYALSTVLCCANCQATDGTSLGVNCADPYTADRNGTQFSLGPRWQVNAHTGAFAYPAANPAWSGSTARRLEFAVSDADTTPGVRYFGEGQYVTPDDAAAGNQNNNASYRELALDLAGANFAFAGTTQREQSAIRAWGVCETGVTLNDVPVAGDGLFVVGYKTTNLGAGQYHYEYAVYNMNSDRNGGSFSIPLPAGATLSNVGFHDVTYRNTDGAGGVANFSGTDWTVTQNASSITWACEAQGVNTNANALRWGTTYNFRFDANVPPTGGVATIGLWKSGAPANATMSVDVPSGGFTNFCLGDGTSVACPCANSGAAGSGCANSSFGVGGHLNPSGTAGASAGTDSLVLTATNITGPALFVQANGLGGTISFGDGQLCASVGIIRLGVVFPSGSTASYPGGLTPNPIHTAGFTNNGDVRHYQVWYRDAAVFCTLATNNLTQGVTLTWGP